MTDYDVLVLRDIYWLTRYEHEAAMKLGWNTTRMREGSTVCYVLLTLDVITKAKLANDVKIEIYFCKLQLSCGV